MQVQSNHRMHMHVQSNDTVHMQYNDTMCVQSNNTMHAQSNDTVHVQSNHTMHCQSNDTMHCQSHHSVFDAAVSKSQRLSRPSRRSDRESVRRCSAGWVHAAGVLSVALHTLCETRESVQNITAISCDFECDRC